MLKTLSDFLDRVCSRLNLPISERYGKVSQAKPHGVIYRGHPWSGLVPRNSGSLLDVGKFTRDDCWGAVSRGRRLQAWSEIRKSQSAGKYGRRQDFYHSYRQHSYCPLKPRVDSESWRRKSPPRMKLKTPISLMVVIEDWHCGCHTHIILI